jgi:hypothetical protein
MTNNLKKYLKISVLISIALAIISQLIFVFVNRENFDTIGYFIFPISFLAGIITSLVFSYNYRQIIMTEGAFKPNFIFNVIIPIIPLALLTYFGYRNVILYYAIPLIIVRLSNQVLVSNVFAKEKADSKELFAKDEKINVSAPTNTLEKSNLKNVEISEKEQELLKKENELLQKEIKLLKKEKELDSK